MAFRITVLLLLLSLYTTCGPGLDNDNTIKEVFINGDEAEVDRERKRIEYTLPRDADLTEIDISIILNSSKATIIPNPKTIKSYRDSILFIVKAENGKERRYYASLLIDGAGVNLKTYREDEVVRAGEFAKPDLFSVDNFTSLGRWSYTMSIDGRQWSDSFDVYQEGDSYSGFFSPLTPAQWSTIPDGTVEAHFLFSKDFVEKDFPAIQFTKEQHSIYSWRDLQGISYDLGRSYTLAADIDWSESDEPLFRPVGPSYTVPFTGTFNGNGHRISNLLINVGEGIYAGLFGVINAPSATVVVENLTIQFADATLEAPSVYGGRYVGGLVGYLESGSIERVGVEGGAIYGNQWNSYTGGFIGGNSEEGRVENCYTTASVGGDYKLGGFVGINRGEIGKVYSTGQVTGTHTIGGFGGENRGTIADSYWNGDSNPDVSGLGEGAGGIEEKSSLEMQDSSTYQPGGDGDDWDFITVWIIDPLINEGYPFLRNGV